MGYPYHNYSLPYRYCNRALVDRSSIMIRLIIAHHNSNISFLLQYMIIHALLENLTDSIS